MISDSPPTPGIRFVAPRLRVATYALLAAGLAVGSAWVGGPIGWLGVVFFGAGSLVFLVGLWRRHEITVDENGFGARLMTRTIRHQWSDVARISILEMGGRTPAARMVTIHLVSGAEVSTLAKVLTSGGEGDVTLGGPGINADQLLATMIEYWEKSSGAGYL